MCSPAAARGFRQRVVILNKQMGLSFGKIWDNGATNGCPTLVDIRTYTAQAGGVRTTVRLDDRLLSEAKRYAAQSGRTLTSVIDEGLRDLLARRAAPLPAGRITLPTAGSGGLQPGVTIDSNAALLDVMDRRP